MTDYSLKLDGLEKLLKALKDNNPPVARIGILGEKAQRASKKTPNEPNNATIGAFHEFGTSQLPVRSFLRLPLSTQLFKKIEGAGGFTKGAMAAVIKAGSVEPWVKTVAVLAEATVLEAFDTGGYGSWVPSDMSHKKVAQTLVETGQLRDSITSEVKRSNG